MCIRDRLLGGGTNTIIGSEAGKALNNGGSNTIVGRHSAYSLTSGDDNVAIGVFALYTGTTVSDNVAIGRSALTYIRGDDSVAVGYYAGLYATGSYNTFVGSNAGKGGTTSTPYSSGQQNIAMGYQALQAFTTGGQNVAIGHQASMGVSTGAGNVVIGRSSFSSATTTSKVVLVGDEAGKAINNTGADGTVAVGYQALTDLTTGGSNTALGYRAGLNLTTGGNNVAIGYDSFVNAVDACNSNIAIGSQAMITVDRGSHADATVNGNIAILEVDNPPVNPLSSGVRAGLSEYIAKANNDESIEGIILTGAGRSFIAGADISEFGQKPDGPDLHTALKEIEFSKKPVLAAINGTALGGGLETALVCNYRMGTNKAIVGLPEVNLGLLPGAGGTQRLPRLIGPSQALKMMIAGTPMSAKKALQQGVIDAISENSLMDDAIAFLQEKIGLDLNEHPKVRDKNEKVLEARGDDNVLSEAKALAAKTRRGQFAPGQIIACVEAAINEDDFDIGMKKESEYFLECLINPQREAMIHIFFGERAASKISDIPKETPLLPINLSLIHI